MNSKLIFIAYFSLTHQHDGLKYAEIGNALTSQVYSLYYYYCVLFFFFLPLFLAFVSLLIRTHRNGDGDSDVRNFLSIRFYSNFFFSLHNISHTSSVRSIKCGAVHMRP